MLGGVTEQIASLRHKHYEEKRKGKIRLIEDTIKHGVLASLKETFPNAPGTAGASTIGKVPPRMSASVGAARGRNVSQERSSNITSSYSNITQSVGSHNSLTSS